MTRKRFVLTIALLGALAGPALAQTAAPAPAPTTTTTTAPRAAAAKPAAKTVNVNTAGAKELDALPGIGAARSKTILAERAKGNFKDWADFDKRMTGSNLNTGVRAKLKDLVTF